jgi:hypothetical protein
LWALPPARLAEVLTDLVPSASEGAAVYYADVLASVVGLAVHAPGGPPGSSADFLGRLDAGWLAGAYAGQPDRLGEAQARALTELVAEAASTWSGSTRRAGLLVLDEFSAVAGRVPVHELTERCRSLGLAVVVTAQSWEGLAPDESARARLAGSSAGGVVVMRCPDPDALCSLVGTRTVIEVGRKLIRPGRYGDEGSGRVQNAWVADPGRVRNFRAGQAAWIHENACTYVQVAPWRPAPRALPTGQVTAVPLALEAARPGTPDPADALAGPAQTGPEVPLPGGAA